MRQRILNIGILIAALSGCSHTSVAPSWDDFNNGIPVRHVDVRENPVPGTVDEPWSEPMFDTVRVPGQLDPEGVYYRLPHEAVVENRVERVQEVQFPNDSVSSHPRVSTPYDLNDYGDGDYGADE